MLNFDVLAHIMVLIPDRRLLLVFGSACRSLLKMASREVLRRGVTIHRPRHLQPFLAFTARFSDSDFSHLCVVQSLTLSPNVFQVRDSDIDCLAEVLRRCKFVKLLAVPAHILSIDPKISLALSSLQHVQSIALDPTYDSTTLAPYLAALQSQIGRAHV